MKWLSPTISRLARLRLWRLENWITNPIAAQREVLQDIVTTAQYTEFGRKHNFSSLFSIRTFKEKVPV
ncbi:MAG: GH3 auxin-responsive promoter family protein, partial [Chitinophagaceae bacterium]|nr:GH3 auxin-responsive promoter family protein [Chitinophagaceae bacterium]